MKRSSSITSTFYFSLASFGILLAADSIAGAAEDWSRFLGPNGSGTIANASVPTTWSKDSNIKWAKELPGLGSSSPVVAGDRVYLTSYTGYGQDSKDPGEVADLKRHLLCYDRKTGDEIWRTTVASDHDEDPYKGFICEHGYASSTPVIDGDQIFVLFGKTGMVAFDTNGQEQWKTNVGTFSDPRRWGSGASCISYKDLVIVNAGNVGHALVALNKSDGQVAWQVDDGEFVNGWSTPAIATVDGHDELVLSTPKKIVAFNPNDGVELWRADSPIQQTVCGCVVVDGEIAYAMGDRAGVAVAVRCGGQGDVTQTHVLWSTSLRSGICTPIIANDRLYWSTGGIAYCADCKTGKYIYKERIKSRTGGRPAGDYASPVRVGDNIFMLGRSGTTFVVKASDKFEKLATNQLEDEGRFNATPAISGTDLFLRSEKTLYCISEVP